MQQLYVITNGVEYFRYEPGCSEVVSSIDDATKWKHLKRVSNVLNNTCKGKQYKRYHFQVKPIWNVGQIKKEQIQSENSIIAEIKNENHADSSVFNPVKLTQINVDEKVSEFSDFVQMLEIKREYLNGMLSEVDQEIVDIEHAAEFYTLNASKGYKLYKMLHDCRVRRRGYKNELRKITYILNVYPSHKKLVELDKQIAGLEEQKYKPRVLKELFQM